MSAVLEPCTAGDAPAMAVIADGERDRVRFRPGVPDDAPAIAALIASQLEAGHLLPRAEHELREHAHRFVLVVGEDDSPGVVGCAELAPLSRTLAEVRSLVVDPDWRGRGIGSRLVRELLREAALGGYTTLCAFTHEPSHFVRLGFAIVPHVWIPEKIGADCVACPKFRVCGQHAMALPVTRSTPARRLVGHAPHPVNAHLDTPPIAIERQQDERVALRVVA